MRETKRFVKANLDCDGMVIYRLLKGTARPETEEVFGYGMNNKVWVKIEGLGTSTVVLWVEPARGVKERIANWVK
jgi:hypothetical protein